MQDVFVGVEQRLRCEELHESFNRLGQKSCKVAADEASSTSEGQTALHTSGGVLVAAAHHLVPVVDASGGKVEGLEGDEGRAADMWIKCQEIFTSSRSPSGTAKGGV